MSAEGDISTIELMMNDDGVEIQSVHTHKGSTYIGLSALIQE